MSRRDDIEDVWEAETADDEATEASASARHRKSRPVTLDVLFEDADLLVINKPAGLPTGLDESGPETVLDQLAERLNVRDDQLVILEHMAAGVTGVLLVARSALARQEMPRQFGRAEVEKTYLAIVRGGPAESEGDIDMEMGPDKAGPARMRIGGSHARPAQTHWTLRDRFAGIALLECRTRRERIDQVRLHLQAAGMPLAVDTEYGGQSGLMLSSFKPDYRPSRRHDERPLIARISLHALAVAFKHPGTGADHRIEAPIPKDFRAALNQLDKHGRIGIPPPQ